MKGFESYLTCHAGIAEGTLDFQGDRMPIRCTEHLTVEDGEGATG